MTRSILASLGERAMPLILAVMLLVVIATQCEDPQSAPVDPGPVIEGSEG